ncbi:MAG TPA: GNAT family N-acetyltransferase, partial [Gemmatimonadaceae bacterium]|nr:GNAT family N-acetyltransferase [Gemmatimonadaceae bacterium]
MTSDALPLLHPLPDRIATSRLVLRPWNVADAPVLKALIDANLEHLQAWMPWAMNEPSPVEAIAQRIEIFATNVHEGTDFIVGVFLGDEAIGGSGLHRRAGPDTLEIGYWIASSHTRRGYASEAATALTRVAFAMPHVEHVQIRCDPRNSNSASIPRKLGFSHIATLEADTLTPTGERRATMVWQISRATFQDFAERPMSTQTSTAAPVEPERALLRHAVATLAYRAAKACRDAPAGFTDTRAAADSRSAGEILAHLGDLIEWVDSQARGAQRWNNSKPSAWADDVARFHGALQRLDDYLASGAPLHHEATRLFQGGIADALTHVGQINLLRRLAGSPVRGENYAKAPITIGTV